MLSRSEAPAVSSSRGIGEILLSEGAITGQQLQEAYRLGRKQEVGRTLLSLGYVDQSDLAKALASRLRLEYIELSVKDVDPEAASLVDKKLLCRHRRLPLRVEDGPLVVAMGDPTNLYALEDLWMLSGYPVSPVVVAEVDLRRVFGTLFSVGDEVADLLEEAGQRGRTGLPRTT
jgi:hypothetical protein